MSAGSAVSKCRRHPVRGWSKPRLAACNAWRGKSSRAPRTVGGRSRGGRGDAAQVDGIADQRVPDARQVDADLVRPPGREHDGEQARGRRPGALRRVVGQRRLAAPSDDGHALAVARVASDGALDVPAAGDGTPQASGYVVAVEVTRGKHRPTALASAASVLATTITPDVSLSSRCTMPGRLSPPIPGSSSPQCASRALTSVPSSLPGGRMDDQAGGLVEDDQVRIFDRGC